MALLIQPLFNEFPSKSYVNTNSNPNKTIQFNLPAQAAGAGLLGAGQG